MTGEVVGVYYNKAKLRKLGLKVPTTFAAFEQALAKAKAGGRDADPVRQPRQVAGDPRVRGAACSSTSARRTRANFIFGAGGGKTSFSRRARVAAATKLQAWAKAGYFTNGYAGLGYDPSWQAFGKGNGRLPDQRQLADRRPEEGARQERRLLPAAAARRASRWRRSAARACRGRSARSRRTPTPRRRTSTSSRATRRCRSSPNNGQLTATKAKVKVPAGLDTEVYNAWTKANKQDAIVPYLDWATPTMYDTITAAIQELMAGKTTPSSFVDEDPVRLLEVPQELSGSAEQTPSRLPQPPRCGSRLGSAAGARRVEPPGAPRRIAYLYLLPALAVYAAFVLAPLGHTIWLSLHAVGRPDADDLGRPRQLPRDPPRRRAARRRSSTRSS